MITNNLIFDFGFHNGDDTDFYLRKGFNVVALEANLALVEDGRKRFQAEIAENRLNLINKALADNTNMIDFYIHPTKSDWSSADKKMTESDGSLSVVASIQGITLFDLCERFGVPHYLKIDVEGGDAMVCRQIVCLSEKPPFVSSEISKKSYAEIFMALDLAGYKKFQFVNQLNNPNRKKSERGEEFEGLYIEYEFSAYSSGFFGKDLPSNRWIDFDEAMARYLKYRDLKFVDNQELALGWLDIHARF